MIKKINIVILFGLIIALTTAGCDKKPEEEVTPESSFDKVLMLTNIGENLVIPAYSNFKISIDSLYYLNSLFTSSPSSTNLANVQSQFLKAYTYYQWVSTFEFGPGENELIRANFNIFPCDTLQIKNKIAAGDFNFSSVESFDAKGFPALDFLLYGNDHDNNNVLAQYTTDGNAANRKNYLTAIINELKNKTDLVISGWNAGNYIATFKNNTGSDVGGSIGMLVNQLNYDFELLKNAKVGIPLGKKTLGTPMPEKVEALYSTQSLALVTEHLKSIENIYLGRNVLNVDGLGLDDYLVHVNAQHSSGALNDVIKATFSSAKAKLALITGPLSQAVITNTTTVDAAYAELQKLVVLLKVDMPSALGVLITYQDNDGD
ncbi:MAG: imelysin family protein [Bacteroidota bacterium]